MEDKGKERIAQDIAVDAYLIRAEKHKFDNLIKVGLMRPTDRIEDIIKEAKHHLVKGDKYQAYRRLLMLQELNQGGGLLETRRPPKGRAWLKS